MRRLMLKSFQSPGDILMLTAAVRDLHRAYPKQFETDVRTSADALWENNPFITKLKDQAAGVQQIDMHYPLIQHSNQRPYHFLHGYVQYLEDQLNLRIAVTGFQGDIHLSAQEKTTPPPGVERGLGERFWIVMAGGKYDFTAKWWNPANYQKVVDHFQGKIQFVQCGEQGHWHPRLNGVVDLVGKTKLRDFVRLMYHAEGVLCPVTFAMHLAAAVPTKMGRPRRRACVVVAGGRESPHWFAYPHHQVLSTVGALTCCMEGGCWKSRCQLVGDGDLKDRRDLCEKPVQLNPNLRIPRCMEMIAPEDVIRRMEMYYQDGAMEPRNRADAVQRAVPQIAADNPIVMNSERADFGMFLTCHHRTTELLCHLDILKYGQAPYPKVVFYSGNAELGNVPNLIKFTPERHGAVAAVLWSLREARQRGLKTFCVRNGDDWLFRHDLVEKWRAQLDKYALVGYNWWGAGRLNDITVNELYLKVSAFDWLDPEKALRALYAKPRVNAEYELAAILKPNRNNFYRLSEREVPEGIGNRWDGALDHTNNRWLHRPWQLLTTHYPWQRWEHYKSIRLAIDYHEALEKEAHFGAWVNMCRELEKIAPQLVVDGRTLLSGEKLFYLGEKAIETREILGDVAEVGVFKGGSLKLLAQLSPGKAVHGFDTFCGLPKQNELTGKHRPGDFACSLGEVDQYVRCQNVRLHKGIFPETAIGLAGKKFSLAHIDADTYQSTADAIRFFWPRLSQGGWLVIDDFEWGNDPGVTKAILEKFDRADIVRRPESDHQAMLKKK